MLKTERMKKVVVAGAKPHLRTVVDTLHRLAALHIEEHRPDAFFGLGNPLPEGERIAEALLKARGLEKSLGLEDERATYQLDSVDAAVARIDAVETAMGDLVAERAERVEETKRLEAEIVRLRRIQPLGLRLEHLSGYQNLKVYVGTVTDDPSASLSRRTDRFTIQKAADPNGLVIALFVPLDSTEAAEAALAEHGWHALDVPPGDGPADTAIGARTTAARQAQARIEAIDAALARYRAEEGAGLLAATDTLTAAAEKAGAPLRFAAGPNSFVVSGYVPVSQVAATERALLAATDQRLFIEWSDPRVASHHGHHTGERHQEHTGDPAHASTEEPDDPPIKFAHKRNDVNSFTMLLGMHSLPKYKEIDPTILMWIAFPIFFGLMVADVAFGILVGLLAWFFHKHYVLGIGGPKVSRMLMLSAVWTFLFGLFMFGEAFGIHFVDAAGALSWEHLLHQDWSHYYASAHDTMVASAQEGGHATEGGDDEHHDAPHLKFLGIQLGYFSKLHDVTTLLIISILIAAVHLNLAILIGIRNMWVLHGAKHAILGRFSWLVLQAGIVGIAYGAYDAWALVTNVGWGLFIGAVLMLLAGEGPIAILELPKIFSNALSYTRLTAVGLSKAGMILAVNTFAFSMTGDHTATINGIGGVLLAIVGYLVILGLGVLAGGLHSMRLQFVEFFGWFYEGGGREFKAFGDPERRS